MPRASRSRTLPASPGEVWAIVSDPYHLPRWWPRAERVENVELVKGGRRSLWTLVLGTNQGKGVRVDYRCIAAATEKHYAFEQQVEDTPFARFMRECKTEISLEPESGGTRVTISTEQRLRGLSRLGGVMMRRATGSQLEEALSGLEQAIAPHEDQA